MTAGPTPVTLPRVGDLDDGEVRPVRVAGRALVVVRTDDERYACADRCLHYGVRLSEGRHENGVLQCRWHQWRYLRSGAVLSDECPFETFETYDVTVDGGDLLVDLAPRTPLRRRTAAKVAGR